MLSSASGQVGFFDATELVGPLPGGSFFALLAEHGHRIVRDEDFADCYSVGRGRPSIPPSLLAKVCCWSTGPAARTGRRWRASPGICAGRSRWGSPSITAAFTPPR